MFYAWMEDINNKVIHNTDATGVYQIQDIDDDGKVDEIEAQEGTSPFIGEPTLNAPFEGDNIVTGQVHLHELAGSGNTVEFVNQAGQVIATTLGCLTEEGYKVYVYERVVDEETGSVKWTCKVIKVDSEDTHTPEKPQEQPEISEKTNAEKPEEDQPEVEQSEEQAAPEAEASDQKAEVTKESSREESALPETGEAENHALFGAAAISVLTGLGLVGYRRRED